MNQTWVLVERVTLGIGIGLLGCFITAFVLLPF